MLEIGGVLGNTGGPNSSTLGVGFWTWELAEGVGEGGTCGGM